MADINEVNGVFGGVEYGNSNVGENGGNFGGAQGQYGNSFGGVQYDGQLLGNDNNYGQNVENYSQNLPAKRTKWSKFKAFWLQEIKVELTPHQQKIENEINEFLHQDITWEKVHDFLFQEITFGKKKNK